MGVADNSDATRLRGWLQGCTSRTKVVIVALITLNSCLIIPMIILNKLETKVDKLKILDHFITDNNHL